MFKIGNQVIYGNMGVCDILDICVPDVEGATRTCYLLQPLYFADTKIYAPTSNNNVTMRNVMSEEETLNLIDSLAHIRVFEEQDKAESLKTFKSAIQSADGYLLAKLMKTLYQRRKEKLADKKMFPNQEKELLTTAEHMFHGEVAYSLNMDIKLVPEYISNRQQGRDTRTVCAS